MCKIVRTAATIGVVAMISVGAAAADQQKAKPGEPAKQPAMQPPPAKVAGQNPVLMTLVTSTSRLASAPAQHYGLRVSVHAPVADVIGPRTFTLDEDAWFSGPDVMVLVPELDVSAAGLEEDEYVTVSGVVRPFVRADLERDYDWFSTLPDLDVDLQSRPVIVAENVRSSDGTEIATSKGKGTRVYVTSPGFVAQTPGRFYGRNVSVRAEIEDVKSQRLFTLDEDKLFAGPDLLVLNPFPLFTPADNEVVTVIGTVRPLISAEFERDYDWFDAADYGTQLQEYERRPVVVAHAIAGRENRQIVRVMPGFTLDGSERAMAKNLEGQSSGQPQRNSASRAKDQATGTSGGGSTPTPDRSQSAGQPVTDMSQLLATSDIASLKGRRVSLSSVPVQRVTDPRTVWVGQNAAQSLLVVLKDAGTSTTGQSLAVGDRVTVEGTITFPPANATGAMAKAPYFIDATKLSRVER